jgi:hypothetical protein
LNSSLSSRKSKPGQPISARVAQDVPLPIGMKIREGARITGHVVQVTPATQGAAAHISFVFDRVVASKKTLPITTNLRAIASPTEVESTQIPTMGMGCGDTWESRTTVQVGGRGLLGRRSRGQQQLRPGGQASYRHYGGARQSDCEAGKSVSRRSRRKPGTAGFVGVFLGRVRSL